MTSDVPLFVGAVACLFGGHVLKAARWGLFITPFQAVRKAHLFRALAIAYALHIVVPYRLGEIARAIALNHSSQLPLSHSLSTVILDRLCDLLVAVAISVLLVAWGWVDVSLLWPLALGGVTLAILTLAAIHHWSLKYLCFLVASPFNDQIKRWLLMCFWSFFTAARMLARRRTAALFALYSVGMWTCYLGAFYLISQVAFEGDSSPFAQQLADHYLIGNLHHSSISLADGGFRYAYLAFLLTPLALILVYGGIQSRLYRSMPLVHDSITRTFKGMFSSTAGIRLLPFLDRSDQLLFLQSFFKSFDHRAVLTLIEQNQDIAVVRNVSGSSNATTLLVIREERLRFRKYALGPDADRLRGQHEWITAHANRLPLTPLLDSKSAPGYFSYDMPHSADAYDLFTFIHSHSVDRSWTLIKTILDTVSERLHQPTRRPVDAAQAGTYLREKYLANLRLALQAPGCAVLAAHGSLLINTEQCRNLDWFVSRYDVGLLLSFLAGDVSCAIHGDLTVENIIVDPASQAGYYLIDPNPVNLFDSELIDFAKLRQSLHLGYEFLLRESICRVQGDTVIFRHTVSQAYRDLCARLDRYLLDRFGENGLRSVCLHELIHFARMMPYKNRQSEVTAHLFYATLVLLHNRFHDSYLAPA